MLVVLVVAMHSSQVFAHCAWNHPGHCVTEPRLDELPPAPQLPPTPQLPSAPTITVPNIPIVNITVGGVPKINIAETLSSGAVEYTTKSRELYENAGRELTVFKSNVDREATDFWDEYKEEIITIAIIGTVGWAASADGCTVVAGYIVSGQQIGAAAGGGMALIPLFATQNNETETAPGFESSSPTETPQQNPSDGSGRNSRGPASDYVEVFIPDNSTGDQSNNGVMLITRELNFTIAEKFGAHSVLQVVENGKVHIFSGNPDFSSSMISPKLAIHSVSVNPGSSLPPRGEVPDSYQGYGKVEIVKIQPPDGMSQSDWNRTVIDSGLAVQQEYSRKLDYALFGGDDGQTSGNCHTVSRMILERASSSSVDQVKSFKPKLMTPGLHCGN